MSEKRPRWESELLSPQHINPVACETCKFRASIASDGSPLDRSTTGICEIYEYPESKPNDVYYDGAECEFYEKADDRPLALIMGVAVGDALGVPVEFKKRGTFYVTDMQGYGTHNQPAGTWSDDTSLTLALADNLLAGGDRPDLECVAWGFTEWYDKAAYTPHGKVFDVGNATAEAIKRLKKGVAPEKAGGTGERDNGNGSLMRIAPLTFYMYGIREAEARFRIVRDVSSLTHAHEWSVAACYIYVEMLNKLRMGRKKKAAYAELREDFARGVPFISKATLGKFVRILENDISTLPEEEIRSSGFVVDTLEAAFWCFMTTDNYKDAVLKAVNLGDDTDTTGAVTGALAGLAYGLDSIPQEWREQLAAYDEVRRIAVAMPRWDYFRKIA
mgnify:FL=1|nr:MAG TPA_asm: ADP-ribosylglycohydrolase [Caudoviricetes sp.]